MNCGATSLLPVPTVFVVDDDPAVRNELSQILRAEGLSVKAYASPDLFLSSHDDALPGCLVQDLAMPKWNGMELQDALKARDHSRPVIFITGRADIPMSVRAMKRGAVDVLTKPVDESKLLASIRLALEQDRLRREARAEIADIQRRLASLTPRESEVLDHVLAGRINRETASTLGTSEKTIKVHRARVMEKLKVQSVPELIRIVGRGITAIHPPV